MCRYRRLTLCIIACCLPLAAHADEKHDLPSPDEQVRRTTAVALNYCRAALHRIRRAPQKRVFYEEQTRILNNLDLNKIEDPEVIKLYRSILDEIGQVEISDRERVVIQEQFRRSIHRQLGTNFFVIGAQVATGQVGNAIQSGANSWWDYRNTEFRRDSDEWKIEKSEFTSLMTRSSSFLDSFWRLSQKNNIPDRWLIRNQDLDQLARILQERDGEQRLRMLKRMERFMECYPPYWYYIARTQQQLGHSADAIRTYKRLTEIGKGHFRQDDMLASSMANTALLQELSGDAQAPVTAQRVMDYSLRNWESNLICAWVLGRHQRFQDAEELILCNLDEGEEPQQSRIALVSLYYHSNESTKLAGLLQDPNVVRDVPIPGLLLCAKQLGAGRLPEVAQRHLAATMTASVQRTRQGPTVILSAAPSWKIQDAQPEITAAGTTLHSVGFRPTAGLTNADFVLGKEEQSLDGQPLNLVLSYPSTPKIYITLAVPPAVQEPEHDAHRGPMSQVMTRFRPNLLANQSRSHRFQISEISVEGVRFSFRDQTDQPSVKGAFNDPKDFDASIQENRSAIR